MSFIHPEWMFVDVQGGKLAIHPDLMFTFVIATATGVVRKHGEVPLSNREDNKAERISEAEYAVMEVLWDRSPLTAADVCDEVSKPRGWGLATVKTLLGRLVAKGVVETRPDGRRFLYSPLIERVEYVDGESRRLVDRLFGGRASSLFAHLAEREALSDKDISEIEALLKEIKQ